MHAIHPRRFVLALVVLFLGIVITDFLIHGVLLAADYGASAELWRPEDELPRFMPVMWFGQFVGAFALTLLYATGFANSGLRCACFFGFLIGLFGQSFSLIFAAVMPLPGQLVAKWIVFGVLQGIVLGALLWRVYRMDGASCTRGPAPTAPEEAAGRRSS